MAKLLTEKQLKNRVIERMKHKGVYSEDYDFTIDTYVGMLAQYQAFEKQFRDSGYQVTEEYTNKAGATNERKTPVYQAMEMLRKDKLSYETALCITPKSFESVKKPKVPIRKDPPKKEKKSKLQLVMGDSS